MSLLRIHGFVCALLATACVQAAPAATLSGAARSSAAAKPYLVASADGAWIIDTRTRNVWPRCVEGMHWNGRSCTGVPRLLTHSQALALASQRWKAEGVAWRLPRVNELKRLVDKNQQPPGLNPELFPSAPADWHWTATANVNASGVNRYDYSNVARAGEGESTLSAQKAWAVDLSSGEASPNMGRGTALPVRLIRPIPAGVTVPSAAPAVPAVVAPAKPSAAESEEDDDE
jgi:hypothetical protein